MASFPTLLKPYKKKSLQYLLNSFLPLHPSLPPSSYHHPLLFPSYIPIFFTTSLNLLMSASFLMFNTPLLSASLKVVLGTMILMFPIVSFAAWNLKIWYWPLQFTFTKNPSCLSKVNFSPPLDPLFIL